MVDSKEKLAILLMIDSWLAAASRLAVMFSTVPEGRAVNPGEWGWGSARFGVFGAAEAEIAAGQVFTLETNVGRTA
jgi:hypothetical protein